VTALDAFGRRCLAWPATILGVVLTEIAGSLLRFAAWLMDYDILTGDNE
jgi:hypothetical protein